MSAMVDSPPEWVKDAVFYAIFPDCFARSDRGGTGGWDTDVLEPWDAPHGLHAYKGGDLWGAAARLDHVAALGANAVYLAPVCVSPSYHRYKPVDLFHVDPMLGGDEALDHFLAEARRRGIRVVLDAVFNHVGAGFRPFQDVLEYGAQSPWAGWFRIQGYPLNTNDLTRPANYDCWADHRNMPRLDHRHPGVRAMLLEAAEHGIRLGAAGWRFDSPVGIDAPGFWQELRARVRRLDPEAYLVGEVWEDPAPWLDGTQWDATTNYPLMGSLWRYAAGGRLDDNHLQPGSRGEGPLDARGFAAALDHVYGRVPPALREVQLNFVDTHDTARYRTAADARSFELATVILFGLPGAPCILYGDEVGVEGGLPPGCRKGFPDEARWDRATLELHRSLIALRRARPSLRRGTLSTLAAQQGAIALRRTSDREESLVVCNAADHPVTLPVASTGAARITVGPPPSLDRGMLTLAPRSAAILG